MSKIRYKRTKNEHDDEKPLPMNEEVEEVMEMKDMNGPSTSSTQVTVSPVESDRDWEGTPQTIYKSNKRTGYYLAWAVLSTVILLTVIVIAILSHPKPRNIKWCCVGEEENTKCANMSKYFSLEGLRPKVDCVLAQTVEDCVELIDQDKADAFTMNHSLLYKYKDKLKPIMAEIGIDRGSYETYLVAVVKKTDITASLTSKSLQSRKACIGSWPLVGGLLANKTGRIYNKTLCHSALDTTKLMNGTCVVDKHHPDMCRDCTSPPNFKSCANDKYRGFSGALRCLLDSQHNAVAFTSSQAFYMFVNDKPLELGNLTKDDFALLCEDGSQTSIDNFTNCHLGKMPSRAIVVSKKIRTGSDRDIPFDIIEVFHVAQLYFGRHSVISFNMFKSTKKPNLLFSDTTQMLMPLFINCTAEAYLGDRYIELQNSLTCSKNHPHSGKSCYLPQYAVTT